MKSKIIKIFAGIKSLFDLRDCFAFSGIALITAGLWMIYSPVSLIVSGSMIFWLGIRRVK